MDNTGVGGTLGTSIGTQTGLLWEFPLLLYCTYEDYGAGLAVVLEEPPTAVHRPRPVPLHLRPGGKNWLKITEFFPYYLSLCLVIRASTMRIAKKARRKRYFATLSRQSLKNPRECDTF